MRKFYSLIAVLITAFCYAQGTVSFENSTITSSYADGSFQEGSVTVTYVHSRNEGLGTTDNFSIQGKGIMLRRADEPSSVTFTIPNGVGEFQFQYRKAFTGGNVRALAVVVENEEIGVTPEFGEGSGANAEIYTYTVPVQSAGNTNVKITYRNGFDPGNRQATIDNVKWSAYGTTLSTINYEVAQKSLQNTVWSDVASFSSKSNAKVEIFNANGQLVKTFEVNGNKNVNVSDLAAGVYVVNTTEDGKLLSTKVVKK